MSCRCRDIRNCIHYIDSITEIIPEFIKKCDDKISSLNRELSSMRSEDRRYHKKH